MKIPYNLNLDNKSIRKIWFMSDLHLGHKNIIKLGNRPFHEIEEMDGFIQQKLAETIEPGDVVFNLGDFFWKYTLPEAESVLKLMKPYKSYMIAGNHDSHELLQGLRRYFNVIADRLEVTVIYQSEKYYLVMDHFPHLSWNHKARGAFMIHGHCHGNIDSFNRDSIGDLRVDVGYDGELAKRTGSFLIDFETILGEMKNKVGQQSFTDYVQKNSKTI